MINIKKYFVRKMLNKWDERDSKILSSKTLPTGVEAITDVPYIDDGFPGHLLDIYYPCDAKGKLPVMLELHGGGFMSGSKELNKLYGYYLAKRGFIVFNINYRLAFSDTKVPGQIKDVAAAAYWISNHMDNYPADREKVYIAGHSAGGVLALMEVLISQNVRLERIFKTPGSFLDYKGLILDCGMMIFYEKTIGYWGIRSMCFDRKYKKAEYYKNMIWDKIQEISNLPPVYLISNEKDEIRHMTLEFEEILKRNQVTYKFNYEKSKQNTLGHMAIIFNPESAACSDIMEDMVRFFGISY